MKAYCWGCNEEFEADSIGACDHCGVDICYTCSYIAYGFEFCGNCINEIEDEEYDEIEEEV